MNASEWEALLGIEVATHTEDIIAEAQRTTAETVAKLSRALTRTESDCINVGIAHGVQAFLRNREYVMRLGEAYREIERAS